MREQGLEPNIKIVVCGAIGTAATPSFFQGAHQLARALSVSALVLSSGLTADATLYVVY